MAGYRTTTGRCTAAGLRLRPRQEKVPALQPAKSLSIAIDSTVLTAYPFEENSKIEVLAGRIEREDGKAFACAIPRRTLARVLVGATLKQCGWSPSKFVNVVDDGANGMRSLVTQIAPRVASPMLNWFRLAMKLHAIRSSLFSYHYFLPRPEVFSRCERIWRKIREALWRGRAAVGIELTRMLAASMKEEALKRESTMDLPQRLPSVPPIDSSRFSRTMQPSLLTMRAQGGRGGGSLPLPLNQ